MWAVGGLKHIMWFPFLTIIFHVIDISVWKKELKKKNLMKHCKFGLHSDEVKSFVWIIQYLFIQALLQTNEKLSRNLGFNFNRNILNRFKARHGIHKLLIESEKLNSDSEIFSNYMQKIKFRNKKNCLSHGEAYY